MGWYLLLLCGISLFAAGQTRPPTGIFAAGVRHLYLHCEGRRHGPAVIFASGLNEDSSVWRRVQPEVARFTVACSYDREGLGKSTADGIADTDAEGVDELVVDLRQLLAAARISPPYIMVGHSAGGVLVRRFARDETKLVTGMVLVDSAHEEQTWRFKAIDPSSVQGPPADPERVRLAGGLSKPGERLVWHDDIPLIVLEHGVPFQLEGNLNVHAAEFEACMHAMQMDLASRSNRGELRTATRSGHDIMLDQPEFTTQAIRDVWRAAR